MTDTLESAPSRRPTPTESPAAAETDTPADRAAAAVERFDIADGGPFVGLQERLGLLEQTAAFAPKRAIVFVGIAFGVPLLLSLVAGQAWGPVGMRPFLLDWAVWARFVVAIVILVLFGRGRISEMMGDFGKGISSFKKGMSEEESASSTPASKAQIEAPAKDATETKTSEKSDSAS